MGQPNPPGDIPLIDGLGSEWNEFVSAIPEEQRAVLGPKLKERIDAYEPLKQWDDFQKSGVSPEQARTAIDLFATIENNPRQVYDTIGKYLGVTPAEAKEVVKEVEKQQAAGNEDPRIESMAKQIEVLSQITLANNQMSIKEQADAEADKALEAEINGIKQKYGNDIHEDQILMRMVQKGMSAEEAYQEYAGFVNEVRSRRPAPMIMGTGGAVPNRAIDPTKLDSKGTKNLVAQMLDHANAEAK